MENWTNAEVQQMLAEVSRRASLDREFRKIALENGKAAIAKINPKPFPPGVAFRFVDNSGPVKTVPLPDLLPDTTGEISEFELENIAGAGDTTSPTITGGWSKLARVRK
jgi:hypothetical protein